jgi:hypothetical protein
MAKRGVTAAAALAGSVRPDHRPMTAGMAAADGGRGEPPSRRCWMRAPADQKPRSPPLRARPSFGRPTAAFHSRSRRISACSVAVPAGASERAGRPTARPWPPSKPPPNRRRAAERLRAGRLDGHVLDHCGQSPPTAPPRPILVRAGGPSQAQIPPDGATGTEGEVQPTRLGIVRRRPHAFVAARFRDHAKGGAVRRVTANWRRGCYPQSRSAGAPRRWTR